MIFYSSTNITKKFKRRYLALQTIAKVGKNCHNRETIREFLLYLRNNTIQMNDKPVKDYGSIRVPQSLVEDLKAWRQAFINVDSRPMTYECMFQSMLEGIKESHPEVYREMVRLRSDKSNA